MMRWNLEHELSGLGPGSVSDIPSAIVLFRFRFLRHVFDLEILDDEEAFVRRGSGQPVNFWIFRTD